MYYSAFQFVRHFFYDDVTLFLTYHVTRNKNQMTKKITGVCLWIPPQGMNMITWDYRGVIEVRENNYTFNRNQTTE